MPASESSNTPTESVPLSPKPLIFISHDTRDAELAEAFAKLLSSVSAGVLKTFRSSDKSGTQGIEYGTEWYPKLMDRLSCASDVVCLLTPRSLERPWILYEAGVAKGRLDTPVLGVALGIPISKANVGPFAQFQNCAGDEQALVKLVMQLAERIPDSEPDREVIQIQVSAFLTKIAPLLEKLEKASTPKAQKPANEDNTVARLFEEVKVMFQDLSLRRDRDIAESIEQNHYLARENEHLKREVDRWRQRASHTTEKNNPNLPMLTMADIFEKRSLVEDPSPRSRAQIEQALTNKIIEFQMRVGLSASPENLIGNKELYDYLEKETNVIQRFSSKQSFVNFVNKLIKTIM